MNDGTKATPRPVMRRSPAYAACRLKPPVGLAVRVEDRAVALQRLERARVAVRGKVPRGPYADTSARQADGRRDGHRPPNRGGSLRRTVRGDVDEPVVELEEHRDPGVLLHEGD
jgi:hypothetical protein